MGSAASKQAKKLPTQASQATRIITKTKGPSTTQPEQQLTRRPGAKDDSIVKDGHDPDFLERLQQMGTVQYKDLETKYSRTNEMLDIARARQRNEETAQDKHDRTQPKSRTHPATITSILQSKVEGDSDAQIIQDFNLTPDFLARLGARFSIPPHELSNDIATNELRSLNQPQHPGKKPNPEVQRPKKKFDDYVVEI
ncbi:hypothetical protein TRVA0_061S00320 [Trichomonascus vanleenenianus]|uniref:uncharacterized protein n=1 Tax=Trichomonascus vanleenenianus TaxID=2268995 RepID=UPI003ECA9DCA